MEFLTWWELCYRCATVMEEFYLSGKLKEIDLVLHTYRETDGKEIKK